MKSLSLTRSDVFVGISNAVFKVPLSTLSPEPIVSKGLLATSDQSDPTSPDAEIMPSDVIDILVPAVSFICLLLIVSCSVVASA